MKQRVAVLGASGFAGAELVRRLIQHPRVEIVRVCAADHIGEPIESALPHLTDFTELRFENPPLEEAVRDVDIVLMGLPHTASVEVMHELANTEVGVIDMSGAFRLTSSAAYKTYYGAEHPAPSLLSDFVYGLPELNRERLRKARRIAAPGCFATSIILSLLPFARAGLLAGRVDTVAVTGSSGAGATPTVFTHHPVRSQNLRAYRALSHQHAPEIEAALAGAGSSDLSFSFVPIAAPLARGILATSLFSVGAEHDADGLRLVLERYYEAEPFVRIPRGRLPEVVAVSGSNYAEVGVAVGPVVSNRRMVSAFCALDNLIKGGAGQSIQNLNLMLGCEETLTLSDPGPFP